MAVRIDETIVMIEERDAHLDPAQIAAFVDHTATGGAQHRIETHLAVCADCRAEVADVARIVAESQRRRSRPAWIAGVAAAALVTMVVWPRGDDLPVVHREAPVTTSIAPAAIHPVGPTDSVPALTWTAVPHAVRYRVRVFGNDGSVLWERESVDTTLAFPVSRALRAGRTYYWNVEAQIGFDRTVASELIEFSFRLPR